MWKRRRERKALEAQQRAYDAWDHDREEAVAALETARTFEGTTTNDLMLRGSERAFLIVEGASLIEDRRGAGHWEGQSSGFSVPVASVGGRSIRYHVGQSRGHYVQGAPLPTAIDHGKAFITDQRVVFLGAKQTRECVYAKLLGVEHESGGVIVLSVSNRQKATVIGCGAEVEGTFVFRLDLALAHYRNTLPAFISQLESDLQAVEQRQPPAPVRDDTAETSALAEVTPSGIDGDTAARPTPDAPLSADSPPDPLDEIRRLSELRDRGILTDQEFAAKKAELMDRI
jgi:hypothetical protein